jgi:hypothetical protein
MCHHAREIPRLFQHGVFGDDKQPTVLTEMIRERWIPASSRNVISRSLLSAPFITIQERKLPNQLLVLRVRFRKHPL